MASFETFESDVCDKEFESFESDVSEKEFMEAAVNFLLKDEVEFVTK